MGVISVLGPHSSHTEDAKQPIFAEQIAAETKTSAPPSAVFGPCTPLELNFTFPNVLCSMYRVKKICPAGFLRTLQFKMAYS